MQNHGKYRSYGKRDVRGCDEILCFIRRSFAVNLRCDFLNENVNANSFLDWLSQLLVVVDFTNMQPFWFVAAKHSQEFRELHITMKVDSENEKRETFDVI